MCSATNDDSRLVLGAQFVHSIPKKFQILEPTGIVGIHHQ
jgi:hypothetical protein